MKTVLHLTPAGSQLWRKGPAGWQAHDGASSGPVWVLTDLAEEGFADLQVPRIFGRDRQAFVARQLASRFPDTPYRTVLPAARGGSQRARIGCVSEPAPGSAPRGRAGRLGRARDKETLSSSNNVSSLGKQSSKRKGAKSAKTSQSNIFTYPFRASLLV